MKFHGIAMAGPFVNQKLSSLPVFDAVRDQGRMVWLTDGTIWYGSDIEWVNFASGSGDASEVEDLYSDLLRTTVFMNASYDGFMNEDLIVPTEMVYNKKLKYYSFYLGQVIESINLFDVASGISAVDYVMLYADYTSPSLATLEVTSNGGVNWYEVNSHSLFRIPDAGVGNDLRIRFTGMDQGVLRSYGVLYNKDLTASCNKYGLTYRKFVATDGQLAFDVDYMPTAIQVFINGDLVDDSDFVATDGTTVTFAEPLEEGDIVYIISFSTSILNSNFDYTDFVNRDGTVDFIGDQSMGNHKLTDLSNGVVNTDAINLGQLNSAVSSVDLSPFIRKNGTVAFTGNQSMGGYLINNLSDGVGILDAVNVRQLNAVSSSKVSSVVAGTNVTVNNTDPRNPVVSVAGTLVNSIGAGTNISINNLDPKNPVVSAVVPAFSSIAEAQAKVSSTTIITPYTLSQSFGGVANQSLAPLSWWQKLPGGLIIQGGRFMVPNDGIQHKFYYPVPFTASNTFAFSFLAADANDGGTQTTHMNNDYFTVQGNPWGLVYSWTAIGY